MWLNVAIGALLCVRPQRDYSTSVIRVPLQKRVAAPVRAATRMAESEMPAEDWEASSMTVKYLQERCRERGLATYGTKAKIIDRLRSFHERGDSGKEIEMAAASYVHRKWKITLEVEMETTELSMTDRRGMVESEMPAEDWEASSVTVKYLQERCRERGLATYGTKAKIIDRLRSCHERGKLFSGEEAEIGRDEAETATMSYVHRNWKIASEVEMETTELSMTTDRRGTPGATWPTGTDMKNTSDVRKRPTSLEQVPNWSRPRLEVYSL